MKNILIYFKRKGYATMKELRNQGFQTRDISLLVEQGKIEKIKAGLYKLSELDSEHSSFIEVCKSIPKGIICLTSALAFHELSTVNPGKIHVAIPHAEKKVNLIYPPVVYYFFREKMYQLGIETVSSEMGEFRIYNTEKTICDIFRYRNKLGEDIALEALKNYLKRKDADLIKLQDYAVKCRVKTILRPYLQAMVAE
jgi:predicted transcriptional regulator of viral defense system